MVLCPSCVTSPFESNASTAMRRAAPGGILMVPVALPSCTVRLNTSGVAMSAAVTVTTSVAIGVPMTFAVTANSPS